jgi:hypothetical protein
MDSSILLCTFYEACYQKKLEPVLLLFTEWGRKTLSEVPCIPDFIELEAINAERFHYKDRKVRPEKRPREQTGILHRAKNADKACQSRKQKHIPRPPSQKR